MPFPYIKDYKEGNHTFPEDRIPFSQKDAKWHLQYANAILADYANNRCGILYTDRDRITGNREWSNGTNDETTFKDIIIEYNRDEGERQAYASLDYSIIPIIAKSKSDFIGLLSTIEHDVVANAIDPISMQKKTLSKMKLWIKNKFQKEFAVIDEQLGIPKQDDEYVPQSKAELDMWEQFGGTKLAMEIGLELAIDHCLKFSRWNEEIRPQLLSDLFDNKVIACRDYFDLDTYTVKSAYVDIANLIVQSSKSPTFDTSRYFGEIKFMTIADLRVATADEDPKEWNEEELQKIAKKYAQQFGNADVNWSNVATGNDKGPFNEGHTASPDYPWNSHLIPVVMLEAQSVMYEHDVEKTDAVGNKTYYKTDRDRKYERSDRKSITTPIKVWHKMSMPLGCNKVFDWGLQHDIPRPTYEDARSSYHVYKLDGKSYCEREIPHAKQIQLMYLKIQGLGLRAIPPGVAVEYGALKNMILNEAELKPMEILKIYHQTGNLVYQSKNQHARYNVGSGTPPVKELKGSYTLNDLLVVIQDHKAQIKEITGIDNSAGKTEPTAFQAKMVFTSTDIALKESHIAYISTFKAVAENAASRLKDLLAYSTKAREIYAGIMGRTNMEMLDMVSDLPLAHVAIAIEVQPADTEKQDLIQAAIAAMKPGKEGVPVLRFSDFLFIQRLANTGRIKYGHAYIAHKESEIEKMAILRSTEAKKMDIEMAKEVDTTKAQNAIESKKFETDEDIRLYQAQKDAEDKLAERQHTRDMELERLKLQIKESQAVPT